MLNNFSLDTPVSDFMKMRSAVRKLSSAYRQTDGDYNKRFVGMSIHANDWDFSRWTESHTIDIELTEDWRSVLWAGYELSHERDQGSIPGSGKRFFSSPKRPDRLWSSPRPTE
jgi:hypothetical protein